MPINTTELDAAIAALTAQVAETETVEESATKLIEGFADAVTKAVSDALTADAAANEATVKAATDAITAVKTRFGQSEDKLGEAITANTPTA